MIAISFLCAATLDDTPTRRKRYCPRHAHAAPRRHAGNQKMKGLWTTERQRERRTAPFQNQFRARERERGGMGFISLTRERESITIRLRRNIKTAVKKERIPNLNTGNPLLKVTVMSPLLSPTAWNSQVYEGVANPSRNLLVTSFYCTFSQQSLFQSNIIPPICTISLVVCISPR